jgi:hypothetical protein
MKQFGEILTGVLAEELGSAFNAEAQSAWKSGLAALVAGISKTLKYVIFIDFTYYNEKKKKTKKNSVRFNWSKL